MNDKKLLTIETVADMLDVSEGTINRFIKQGTLQTTHIGTHLRIPESEVARLIAKGTRQVGDTRTPSLNLNRRA